MYKETIICIIVVALILIGNTLTGNYTKETIETTSENLIELRNEINQEAVNFENIKKKVSDINIEWEERYKTLAYYIEHNELEKFKIQLTSSKAFVEKEKYPEAINEIDKAIYILNNIEEKNSFNLQNIF